MEFDSNDLRRVANHFHLAPRELEALAEAISISRPDGEIRDLGHHLEGKGFSRTYTVLLTSKRVIQKAKERNVWTLNRKVLELLGYKPGRDTG